MQAGLPTKERQLKSVAAVSNLAWDISPVSVTHRQHCHCRRRYRRRSTINPPGRSNTEPAMDAGCLSASCWSG